jgi:hypothetical protein
VADRRIPFERLQHRCAQLTGGTLFTRQ